MRVLIRHKPIALIQLKGRMGNQLFLYALYKTFEAKGRDVKMVDIPSNWLIPDGLSNKALQNNFGISYESATEKDIQRIFWCYRFLPKLFIKGIKFISTFREDGGTYDDSVFSNKNRYIIGWFQSEQYFSDAGVQAELRHELLAPLENMKSVAFLEWRKRIEGTRTCSVHIRRTDYLQRDNLDLYANICTDTYYRNAIKEVLEHEPDTKFFVFSDDKEYIRENYGAEPFIPVDDERLTDIEEFYLMYLCDHHILANSSFSWWPAWLDDNSDALILAPEKWINGKEWEKIYTPRMKKIAIHGNEDDRKSEVKTTKYESQGEEK